MAPPGSSQTLLSPAELSFIHSSLSLKPPVRPDLRTPTQFRPLIAETNILSNTNGSARICLSDGAEAIVGIKAEVERSASVPGVSPSSRAQDADVDMDAASSSDEDTGGATETKPSRRPRSAEATALSTTGAASDAWLELSIDIPGFRDDDHLPVFLGSMLTETLAATGVLAAKLFINPRWHWKLYIDVLLLSPPLSYPLPLLSLTIHLALLNTALPRLVSDPLDDPLFDDDWAAAVPLYPRPGSTAQLQQHQRPPVTLLVMTVGDNVIFDPSREELAVAESVIAVSVVPETSTAGTSNGITASSAPLKLLTIRMIDPPSRLTPPGIPNTVNPATAAAGMGALPGTAGGLTAAAAAAVTPVAQEALVEKEKGKLWTPPRGGMKRALVARAVAMVLEKGGVAEEVVAGLAAVES